MKRKIAAILAADVAGYSRLVAEHEEETLTRLGAFRQVFDDFVKRSGGRIFNTAGDSVMCEFELAVEAVRCAIDIQESLRTRNLAIAPERRLQFRIGITIGDVVERDGDLLGDGVNIAARLESLAEPGGICVSRSVHEAVANKISVPFRDIGERQVKNIPNRVHAFVVAWPASEPEIKPQTRPLGEEPREPRQSAPFILLGAGALAAAVFGFVIFGPSPSGPPAPPAPQQQTESPAQQQAESQPKPTSPQASSEPARQTVQAKPPPAPPTTPAQPQLLADPAEAFAKLSQQGGIVPDAKSAPELYHNARIHEERGEPAQARRAYQALAAVGIEQIDPHLRYSALLRVQDGRAGARQAYAALMREKPARPLALINALQFEGADRRAKVEAFAHANPITPRRSTSSRRSIPRTASARRR